MQESSMSEQHYTFALGSYMKGWGCPPPLPLPLQVSLALCVWWWGEESFFQVIGHHNCPTHKCSVISGELCSVTGHHDSHALLCNVNGCEELWLATTTLPCFTQCEGMRGVVYSDWTPWLPCFTLECEGRRKSCVQWLDTTTPMLYPVMWKDVKSCDWPLPCFTQCEGMRGVVYSDWTPWLPCFTLECEGRRQVVFSDWALRLSHTMWRDEETWVQWLDTTPPLLYSVKRWWELCSVSEHHCCPTHDMENCVQCLGTTTDPHNVKGREELCSVTGNHYSPWCSVTGHHYSPWCSMTGHHYCPLCSVTGHHYSPWCSVTGHYYSPLCSVTGNHYSPLCSVTRHYYSPLCSVTGHHYSPLCSVAGNHHYPTPREEMRSVVFSDWALLLSIVFSDWALLLTIVFSDWALLLSTALRTMWLVVFSATKFHCSALLCAVVWKDLEGCLQWLDRTTLLCFHPVMWRRLEGYA